MQYQELINDRERKCPEFHDVRARIDNFHQMNEAFYKSLSATQVYGIDILLIINSIYLIILVN